MRCLLLIAWLLSGLTLGGCGGSGEDYGPDDPGTKEPPRIPNAAPVQEPTGLTCPNGTYLTYENFGAAFMAKYCTSCHAEAVPEERRAGAPLEANFDSAEAVALWRAAIIARTGSAPIVRTPTDANGRPVTTKPGGSTTTNGGGTGNSGANGDGGTSGGTSGGNSSELMLTGAAMPPAGGLIASDKEALTEWLNCGAPQSRGRLNY